MGGTGVHLGNRYFDFGQANKVQIETLILQNQPNILIHWLSLIVFNLPGVGAGSIGPPQPTLPPILRTPAPPVLGAGLGLGLPMPMDIPIIREGDHSEPLPAPAAPKKKPGYSNLVGWFHLDRLEGSTTFIL